MTEPTHSHPGWLVWLRGLNGPKSQVVFSGSVTPPSKDPLYRDRESVIAERPLKQVEVGMGQLALEQRYPPPKEALS